jgi:hypothetical protein
MAKRRKPSTPNPIVTKPERPTEHRKQVQVLMFPQVRRALKRPTFQPQWLKAIMKILAEHRRRFERGDENALMDGICDFVLAFSFAYGHDWLGAHFATRWAQYTLGIAETLEAAFRTTRPRKPQANAARRNERLRCAVVFAVCHLQRTERAKLNKDTFDRVGEKLKISGDLAGKIFRSPASKELRRLADKLPDFGPLEE